jgi:hypothetical protein
LTDPAGEQLDPTKPTIVTVLGRKGTGKSVLAAFYWDSYPYDELCIDVTRDALVGPGCQFLYGELPTTFPAPDRDAGVYRTKLVYRPDPGGDTYTDDLDRAVSLALHDPNGPCLLWIDERSEFTVRPGPGMRRALNQSRHFGLSILSCGPRAVNMDPLLLSNADYLFLFDLPGVHDRQRVADTIGVNLQALTNAINQLPPHGYLRWDAKARDMIQFPPLPAADVRKLMRATEAGQRRASRNASADTTL